MEHNGGNMKSAVLSERNYQFKIKVDMKHKFSITDCHTDDVEVFTKDGWKNITTLDEFEDVYTLDNLGNVSHKRFLGLQTLIIY